MEASGGEAVNMFGVGDRVQLTEVGAEVAYRVDAPGSMATNVGTVREIGIDGPQLLLRIKRDGAHRTEVWSARFWELVK